MATWIQESSIEVRFLVNIKQLSGFWTTFKNQKKGIIGLLIILFFIVIALFANYLSPYSTKVIEGDVSAILQPPSTKHMFGTDEVGRDIFTLILYGARISLLIGFLASFLSVAIGTVIGMLSGYLGKKVDIVLMRATEIAMVLPGLALMLVLAAILGPSIWNIILIIGILGWTGIARIVRSQVLSTKERTFVEASEGIGASDLHVMIHHIFPNTLQLVLCQMILGVRGAILSEAGLSFLGLGDPTQVSWGMILHDAFTGGALSRGCWWYIVPPGICITLVVLGFIFVGHALDEIINPRLRRR